MGCQALVMRKSTRAHRVDPPNEFVTFQSPALVGWGCKQWVRPSMGPCQVRLLPCW